MVISISAIFGGCTDGKIGCLKEEWIMLVLARPVGEEIVIGNLVRVGIVAVQN